MEWLIDLLLTVVGKREKRREAEQLLDNVINDLAKITTIYPKKALKTLSFYLGTLDLKTIFNLYHKPNERLLFFSPL